MSGLCVCTTKFSFNCYTIVIFLAIKWRDFPSHDLTWNQVVGFFLGSQKYAARFSREIHVLVNDQIMMNHQHQPIFLCVLFVIFSDFSGCPITEIQHSGHRFHGKPFSEVHSISGGNWKEILAKEDDIILEINGIKGDDNAMVWGAQPEPPRKSVFGNTKQFGEGLLTQRTVVKH